MTNHLSTLHIKAMIRNIEIEKKSGQETRTITNKIIFHGIKTIILEDKSKNLELDTIQMRIDLVELILQYISILTPREIMLMFPISKFYDGDRYECKDYFYTMEHIQKHGLDNQIVNVSEFLFEYVNKDINKFMLTYIKFASKVREQIFGISLMEEFIEKEGIKPYIMHKDKKGTEFLLKDGKSTKVSVTKKRKPKYLRLVK